MGIYYAKYYVPEGISVRGGDEMFGEPFVLQSSTFYYIPQRFRIEYLGVGLEFSKKTSEAGRLRRQIHAQWRFKIQFCVKYKSV